MNSFFAIVVYVSSSTLVTVGFLGCAAPQHRLSTAMVEIIHTPLEKRGPILARYRAEGKITEEQFKNLSQATEQGLVAQGRFHAGQTGTPHPESSQAPQVDPAVKQREVDSQARAYAAYRASLTPAERIAEDQQDARNRESLDREVQSWREHRDRENEQLDRQIQAEQDRQAYRERTDAIRELGSPYR